MKSGLVGRNNPEDQETSDGGSEVSMKSGLVGRNNTTPEGAL